jgi:hypothetical protein
MPQPLQAELAHFVDVAHGVCPPGVSGRDGLLAVKWVHNVLGRIKSEVP